jgi:hypothetical protein
MLISDLDYLNEVSSQSGDLSGGFGFNEYGSVRFNEYFDVNKYVNARINIYGNIGTAEADAKAYGYNTVAQTFTDSNSYQGYGSDARSASIAASSPGAYYYWY